MKKRVLLGMSGGVDSSVAAKILLDQGYEVTGLTLQLLEEADPGALHDAKAVADHLGISWQAKVESQRFRAEVIDFFIKSYQEGETPNPCIRCNQRIKFQILDELIQSQGFDYIATGHYAKIEDRGEGLGLYKGADERKDQSYFLYPMKREWLGRTLMPLGAYTKEEIRDLARQWGLPVHNKPDSEDICFIPDGDYVTYIKANSREVSPPGNFVTKEGKVLGRHRGIIHYTLGQRRGLGISLGHRAFVTAIRPEENEVVLGLEEDLYSQEVILREVNYLVDQEEVFFGEGRGRYAGKNLPLRAEKRGEKGLKVYFESPLRAATKGQSVVIYQEDRVVCGGVIDEI